MARRAQFQADFSDEEEGTPVLSPHPDSESEEQEPAGFAQFVDSDDDDGASDSDSDSPPPVKKGKDEVKSKGNGKGKRAASDSDKDEEAELKQGLASIPFGELLKAQQTLSQKDSKSSKKKLKKGRSETDSDSDSLSHHEDDPGVVEAQNKDARKRQSVRELKARSYKNAPTEESSSRPVSRRRQVVEVPKLDRRDPRFSALSGPAKKHEFKAQYGFLNEVFANELKTLKEQYAALTKKERTASRHQAEIIAGEREQVSRKLNRAQALAAERRRRADEDELETELRRQNRQRMAEGKKEFHLKRGEKKQALLRKRYERLAGASEGGADPDSGEGSNSKQLRKALERRRKRNAAKERKHLPNVADPRRAGAKPKRSE